MATSAFYPQVSHAKASPEATEGPNVCADASAAPADVPGAAAIAKQLFSTPFTGHNGSLVPGGRGWRFPSSRRYLWDRNPTGPAVMLDFRDCVPEVEVALSALAVGSSSSSTTSDVANSDATPRSARLQAEFTVDSNRRMKVMIRAEDKLASVHSATQRDTVVVPCSLEASGPRGASSSSRAASEQLIGSFQAQMDHAGSARVSQLFSIDLSLACGSASAPDARADSDGARSLSGALLAPAMPVTLTPLYSKRLADVPLARSLSAPGGAASPTLAVPRGGYLTMDQARNLVPLMADDTTVGLGALSLSLHC